MVDSTREAENAPDDAGARGYAGKGRSCQILMEP